MKLLGIRTMRGPNYWSGYWHKIIVAKLDIEELEGCPTNQIPGFSERLIELMPSLQEHHCSEGCTGGFLKRVNEGTWMAHVVEHITLELQWLAGMKCGFGRTRSTGEKGVYHMAFAYEVPEAGYYAVESAMAIAEHLVKGKNYNVQLDVEELKRIRSRKGLGVTTMAMVEEAQKRDIPWRRMNGDSLIVLGQGSKQKKIKASMTCATSGIGVDVACDKEETKRVLERAYIPVPGGRVVSEIMELKEAIAELGFPLVLKPIDGNHGKGITTNVRTELQALHALDLAKGVSKEVIVERFIEGNDFRFLVVNYKLVAAAQRIPPSITGNGKSTVRELITSLNANPARGNGHEKALTAVHVDKATEEILASLNLNLDSVLPEAEKLILKSTANLSTGGTSVDVTDDIHPDNIFLAERIARLIQLDICGIDIIAKDIRKPITSSNGAVIEVNACPGLRMHLKPAVGVGRNVAEPILDMLYPAGTTSRIPIVAVTGTNGKTTTTRLVAHMARTAGYSTGYTTTDGIYINERMICKGDCTGASSAETILTDPLVDFAVLECARGGILRSGLGFDRCDISIVTNVSEDHIGLDGINTITEMARVKGVVTSSTDKNGYAILNAEDDQAYYLRDHTDSHLALFAIDPANERIKRHLANGGLTATVEDGFLVISRGKWKNRICRISEIPLTFGGKAECMVRNVLAATLAAFLRDFSREDIRKALFTFVPSPEFTPGRFNVFSFNELTVMVDYAHNPVALTELKKFLDASVTGAKIGIIAAVGDRRDEDIRELGARAAGIFSEVIIRLDKDLRGRTAGEITNILMSGIQSANPGMIATVIPDEKEALMYAVKFARPGTYIVTLTEDVEEAIQYVQQLKANVKDLNLLSAITGHDA